MRHRRHAVEEMRRVTRAGLDGRDRLVEAGARVAERHAMAGGNQRPHEIEAARQFRRERDDADIRPCAAVIAARMSRRRELTLAGCRSHGCRRQSAGCAPRYSGLMKLLSRCAGSTRALRGGARRARRAPGEHGAQLPGRTRHRRGTERRHAVTRQPRRDVRHRRSLVQRVDALHAVDVHVDEPGHDITAG